jgi:hypothetical protein
VRAAARESFMVGRWMDEVKGFQREMLGVASTDVY